MSNSLPSTTIDRPLIEAVATDSDLETRRLATALQRVDSALLPAVTRLRKRITAGVADRSRIVGRMPDRLALSVPPEEWLLIDGRLEFPDHISQAVKEAHRRGREELETEPGAGAHPGLVIWSESVAAFTAGGFSLERARVWSYKLTGASHREIARELELSRRQVTAHSAAGHERIGHARALLDVLSEAQHGERPEPLLTVHADGEAAVLFDDGATLLVGSETYACSEHGTALRAADGFGSQCPHMRRLAGDRPQPAIHAADLAELLNRDPAIRRTLFETLTHADEDGRENGHGHGHGNRRNDDSDPSHATGDD